MAENESKTVDPTVYLDKPATVLQARFGDWIKDEVGYNPATAKSKEEAFREGVRIATATRMVFQASDFNRLANEEQRAANAAAREKAKAAKAKADAEAEEEAPRPAKATKAPAKAVKAPAKRAAAPVAEEAEEEPAVRKPARRAPRRATAATAEAPF